MEAHDYHLCKFRAKALELAMRTSFSSPSSIIALADLYDVYIRRGSGEVQGMLPGADERWLEEKGK